MKWEQILPTFPTRRTHSNQSAYPELNQVLNSVKLQDTIQSTDKIGSSYFVEENYDDFIMAKDPPTPHINGTIGILFEQASSRGHAQESANGILTFHLRSEINLQPVYQPCKQQLKCVKSYWYQRDFYKKC
jgi:hypothetical protein